MGFTMPGQAWTYWNRGPGPATTISSEAGKDWSRSKGRTAAADLLAVARALGGGAMPPPG